ncbi:sugar phosphate isomerase/epimerase [Aurantibacter crassamenti]|uniref:sugar phosphate isomerase/epimerase family protein n=1 Tax=Aurantibacter crassamenti TaxID=1837375 RepID=UPI0019397C2B|nr:sugar phosphate isomerase/epimerase family protein [Aurantibacter crassamenti]MBM1107678.1 sugar phosphate isomerase/epimerase [Aurantibacter crassamenti]
MNSKISRRKAIGSGLKVSLAAMSGFAFSSSTASENMNLKAKNIAKLPIRISLNTSTLLHYKIAVDLQIDMVAKAGFDGIELWMSDIKKYLDAGGKTSDLKAKLEKNNLVLENIIGFSKWCSDDAEERKQALVQLREEMNITAALGGNFIAAPVQGISTINSNKYDEYAQRYTAILELGDETGVTPIIELWGMGALHKISDCAQIAIATGHPKATMLLDFYHVYRGGNDWDTIDILNGKRLPVIHINDYPSSPSYDKLKDSDRIFPGDGICPFDNVIPKLYDAGFRGGFSVELFNKEYWNTMDAETLLQTCYDKTHTTVKQALSKSKTN